MMTMTTKVIAIGTDGMRFVIWGVGADADDAESDARAQFDSVDDFDKEQLCYLEVPEDFDTDDVAVEGRDGITIDSRHHTVTTIGCVATGDKASWYRQ